MSSRMGYWGRWGIYNQQLISASRFRRWVAMKADQAESISAIPRAEAAGYSAGGCVVL